MLIPSTTSGSAGGDATVDVVPYAGHQITPAMANALVGRLRGQDGA